MPIPHLRPMVSGQEKLEVKSSAPAGVFLGAPKQKPSRKRMTLGWSHAVWLGVIIVVCGFLLSVGVIAVGVTGARSAALAAEDAVKANQYPQAQEAVRTLRYNLILARVGLTPWKIFSWVPFLGTQIIAVDHTFAAGIAGAEAGEDAFALINRLFGDVTAAGSLQDRVLKSLRVPPGTTLQTLPREKRRELLALLATAGDDIERIAADVSRVDQELSAIPTTGVISALRDTVEPLRNKVHAVAVGIGTLGPIAKLFPPLVGYPDPKTYLLLFANNNELRPVGGFLGSIGLAQLVDGDLASLTAQDIYAVDLPVDSLVKRLPPPPLQKYLGVSHWYLRDANWSPDFPTSAEQIITMYNEELELARKTPQKIDGVLMMTPTLIQDFLRITGPITIDGVTFAADHFVETLEYEVEVAFWSKGTKQEDRKAILIRLMEEIVHRLTLLPADQWPDVVAALMDGLKQKEVLLYAHDPVVAAQLRAYGWDGSLEMNTLADTLLWVDANMAALKTDSVMQRALSYSIRGEEDGNAVATVRMQYKNTGHFGAFTTRYRSYVRVYVPEGSTLIKVDGSLADDKTKNPLRAPSPVAVSTELGRTVYGFFVAVEPGESRTVSVTYRLPAYIPAQVRRGLYRLFVWKQAGMPTIPLTLDMHFDKTVIRATPAETKNHWFDRAYQWTGTLAQDMAVGIGF